MNHAYALPSALSPSTLIDMVRDAREHTLWLVSDLADEQLTVPLMEVVNPFRWELGHIAFFYDVFVLRSLGDANFLLPGAENLYDSFKVDHDDRWGLPLPNREETLAYMQRVLNAVIDRIEDRGAGPLGRPAQVPNAPSGVKARRESAKQALRCAGIRRCDASTTPSSVARSKPKRLANRCSSKWRA